MDVQDREVAWYRHHGKHPERIRRDGSGRLYVIGDWSWERNYPRKPEFVEDRMRAAGVYNSPRPSKEPQSKTCPTCRILKQPGEYYRARASGRLMWECKACARARARKWYAEHLRAGLRLVS